jgi:hypothetical protein
MNSVGMSLSSTSILALTTNNPRTIPDSKMKCGVEIPAFGRLSEDRVARYRERLDASQLRHFSRQTISVRLNNSSGHEYDHTHVLFVGTVQALHLYGRMKISLKRSPILLAFTQCNNWASLIWSERELTAQH